MNKKGALPDMSIDNVVYIVLIVFFFIVMFYYIDGQREGADLWADYYSKRITNLINLAETGAEIKINVQKISAIAKNNEIEKLSDMIEINNEDRKVCVKLSKGRASCSYFYNEVDVTDIKLNLAQPDVNIFSFKIGERLKNDE